MSSVDEELLLRNESLVTENLILHNEIERRLRLTDAERWSLAESGTHLSQQALEEIATIVSMSQAILAVFLGSRYRQGV